MHVAHGKARRGNNPTTTNLASLTSGRKSSSRRTAWRCLRSSSTYTSPSSIMPCTDGIEDTLLLPQPQRRTNIFSLPSLPSFSRGSKAVRLFRVAVVVEKQSMQRKQSNKQQTIVHRIARSTVCHGQTISCIQNLLRVLLSLLSWAKLTGIAHRRHLMIKSRTNPTEVLDSGRASAMHRFQPNAFWA